MTQSCKVSSAIRHAAGRVFIEYTTLNAALGDGKCDQGSFTQITVSIAALTRRRAISAIIGEIGTVERGLADAIAKLPAVDAGLAITSNDLTKLAKPAIDLAAAIENRLVFIRRATFGDTTLEGLCTSGLGDTGLTG